MKLLDFFAKHPVFTYEEFAAFLDAEGSRSVKTRDSLLAHHTKTGRILRVRRGLYASVPFGASPDTFPVDTFLLAGKMAEDAVLAYHTALEFFGKAQSVQERFLFLTGKAIRPVNFRGFEFRGVRFPKTLVRQRQEFFAVDAAERGGLPIRVTSLERTLVDILDRPDLGGGWEEIWRSLESVEFFDMDNVLDYTLLLDNASVAAKVGLYLEQHQKDLMVDDAHLDRLRQCIPKQPTYMARNSKGRLVKEWNLVVPSQVLDRSWEEIS
ncbi:type IV toxin-antitoxin system AbiEi family antitoxin domain-containing protein [Desulfomonile tiedjei]|uniref:Putative transcriptional regulator n=1 Tax=Desulfomonile tiedjei (strain ATCC 49306 / DSM 6799 / DCB-1) TaxID=706587 RepID=I4CF89_DESTA|nr:type IV toxin-antitoxin system AbiEi family antitoxin domain-containing protein [Desulfomonile tiedjei]AFM28230.1 putative transcriptional regulator [Desulfomonile tiedjei DSM 6799]